MSSGAKIGLLLALVIVGVVGAYFAFGPGSDGSPPLQANASHSESDPLSLEAPRGEPMRPVDPLVRRPDSPPAGDGGGPLTESVRDRLNVTDQKPPFVIINRLAGASSGEDVLPVEPPSRGGAGGGAPGTLIGTDLPPIPPDDELPPRHADGGKDGWTPPPAEDESHDSPPADSTEPASPPRNDPTPVAPTARTPTDYVVQAGDNFWSIAEMWFGDGSRHHLIAAANPGVDSSKLRIGQTLKLPPKDAAAAPQPPTPTTPPPAQPGTYTVQPGDTLVSIARRLLKDESKWKQLYDANHRVIGANPDNLKVGMVLTIPR